MSKFNDLYKKIVSECSNISKEGIFTGDNTFSLNISPNISPDIDITTGDNDISLPLPLGEDGEDAELSLKCEVCGSNLSDDENNDFSCEDPAFEHEHVCRMCAEAEAKKYQDSFVQGQEEPEHLLEFIDNKTGDTWKNCALCNELCPESELKDTDTGFICQQCINGLDSRGEEFTVYNNR